MWVEEREREEKIGSENEKCFLVSPTVSVVNVCMYVCMYHWERGDHRVSNKRKRRSKWEICQLLWWMDQQDFLFLSFSPFFLPYNIFSITIETQRTRASNNRFQSKTSLLEIQIERMENNNELPIMTECFSGEQGKRMMILCTTTDEEKKCKEWNLNGTESRIHSCGNIMDFQLVKHH